MKRIKLKETELNTLIKTIIHESALLKEERRINEDKVCRCMGQTWYGHDGGIMCNTDNGVQAWYDSDCCNKTMETPEGCWVSSSVVGPGDNNYQIVGGDCPGCAGCGAADCVTCTAGGEKCVSATDKVVAMPKSRALGEQTIQLRESDLIKLIHRVINEQQ